MKMTEKRYWNYSLDCQPRDRANISAKISDLYESESKAVSECKRWCIGEGLEFHADMVDEVTDLVEWQELEGCEAACVAIAGAVNGLIAADYMTADGNRDAIDRALWQRVNELRELVTTGNVE